MSRMTTALIIAACSRLESDPTRAVTRASDVSCATQRQRSVSVPTLKLGIHTTTS